MTVPIRTRILEATFACIARYGLAKTTMEDAAKEAGLSRATVYRHFPGGRDELVQEVIAWETARFFIRLAEAVAGIRDFEQLLAEGLMFAHEAIEGHEILQKVLQTEPERLIPTLTVESDRIRVLISSFISPHLRGDPRLRPGLNVDQAADYVSRMLLSWIGAPGRWDLTDVDQVHTLVRTEFLAGVLITD
ncbi:MAG: TetR/AcrR family transcriptional regulator [Acidimicrobiales bacterium]